MNHTSPLPFGLRYEERPYAKDFTLPTYDEDEDISVYIDANGQKTPSVECYGSLGTKTETKVVSEGTDEDPSFLKMGGTRTLTEVQNESADSDDTFLSALTTRTGTFVEDEQSDSDEDTAIELMSKPMPKPLPTTKTFTNVVRENTDQD